MKLLNKKSPPRPNDGDIWTNDEGEQFTFWRGQWRRESELEAFPSYHLRNVVTPLPTRPGRYFWTEWDREVDVGIAQAYNWRRPRHSGQRTLCVLPFPGFPHPIKISSSIAGHFHGPV